jgi:PEP-CTERM motif
MRVILHKLPCFIAGLLVAAAIVFGQSAQAGPTTLWYNGDLDGRDALTNQTGAADGLIYDNFIVPTGMTFTITAVFSNDLMFDSSAATTAAWEIRSGVSAGNGGTLLSSGDASDAVSATGRSLLFGGEQFSEFTNLVQVPAITLSAGTYWLSVAPDVSNQNSFITTTSGLNAVGMPQGNDGNSFFSSVFFGDSFIPISDPSIFGPGTWDFSMGVMGTSAAIAVPEPSSLILGLAGMVTSAGCFWTRRRTRP